jgi:hypothetical protein
MYQILKSSNLKKLPHSNHSTTAPGTNALHFGCLTPGKKRQKYPLHRMQYQLISQLILETRKLPPLPKNEVV